MLTEKRNKADKIRCNLTLFHLGFFLAFYGWGGVGGSIWPAVILCNIFAEPLTLMELNLVQTTIDHSAIKISMNDVIITSSFFIMTSSTSHIASEITLFVSIYRTTFINIYQLSAGITTEIQVSGNKTKRKQKNLKMFTP